MNTECLKFLVLFLMLFHFTGSSQVSEMQQRVLDEYWKAAIGKEKYKVTKNKYKIPPHVLAVIGVDTITEITGSRRLWNASCTNEEPGVKLNWAAWGKEGWIVCYTTGGYSLNTWYAFISSDTSYNYTLDVAGMHYYNYKHFRKRFPENKLEKKKTVRALY